MCNISLLRRCFLIILVESLPNENMEIKTVGQAIRERYE